VGITLRLCVPSGSDRVVNGEGRVAENGTDRGGCLSSHRDRLPKGQFPQAPVFAPLERDVQNPLGLVGPSRHKSARPSLLASLSSFPSSRRFVRFTHIPYHPKLQGNPVPPKQAHELWRPPAPEITWRHGFERASVAGGCPWGSSCSEGK
jgi:hypothetical protein